MLIHLTGTIVTWWGRIEGIMVHDLISLRNHFPDYAAKAPFPVQTGNIIRQWSRLQRDFSKGDTERTDKFNELADELWDVSEDRNVLVHYFWPYGGTEGKSEITLKSIKPQKGNNSTLMFRAVEISVEKLNSVNERLMRLYHTIMAGSMNLILAMNRIHEPPTVDKD